MLQLIYMSSLSPKMQKAKALSHPAPLSPGVHMLWRPLTGRMRCFPAHTRVALPPLGSLVVPYVPGSLSLRGT